MARPFTEGIDLEAMHRDFSTGKWTNVELAAKYKNLVTPQRVGQLAKEMGWVKDLSQAVRLATKAQVIRQAADNGAMTRERRAAEIAVKALAEAAKAEPDEVTKPAPRRAPASEVSKVAKALDQAKADRPEKVRALVQKMVDAVEDDEAEIEAQAVMDAAEINAGVIVRHQKLADQLGVLMDRLRVELMEVSTAPAAVAELLQQVRELAGEDGGKIATKLQGLLSLGSRIGNLDKLSSAAVRIVTLERQAHNLDDDDAKPPSDDISDDQLRTRLARFGIAVHIPTVIDV